MIRLLWVAALLCSALSALTLDEIFTKPSGRAKNFLIWQFFQQHITPYEAQQAFEQVDQADEKLYLAYAKHSGDPTVRESARCITLPPETLLSQKSDACILAGLSPDKVSRLDRTEKHELSTRLKASPVSPWLDVMASIEPESDLETISLPIFMKVANSSGKEYRRTFLNRNYSQEFIQKLAAIPGFKRLLVLIVTDDQLDKFQQSLLQLDAPALDAQSHFFLGLNQLRFGNQSAALRHIEHAYQTFYFRMDKDKALFWQFQITKAPQLLQLLSQSMDINLYSLYASEMLDKRVDNYFTTLNVVKKHGKKVIDITNPFAWQRILEEIRDTPRKSLFSLAQEYRQESLLPVQALILERAYGSKMHNYIVPYQNEMFGMKCEKKIIMLSLMRQESYFIPSALSRSYALGLMQMMPFLVRDMDRKNHHTLQPLERMFDPKTNIAYASRHIDYLQQYLYHPMLVAYAYNGGIGFTKRYLQKGAFMETNPYEPFWSMEMMANSETREYGKKVLANYVLYKRIFGEKVSLNHLFRNLMYPSRSDRFRASK